MANGQLKRILRRRPEMDEAEFELLQARVSARLRGATPIEEGPDEERPDDGGLPASGVGVMAEPGSDAWQEPVPVMAAPDAVEVVDAGVPIGSTASAPDEAAPVEVGVLAEPEGAPEPDDLGHRLVGFRLVLDDLGARLDDVGGRLDERRAVPMAGLTANEPLIETPPADVTRDSVADEPRPEAALPPEIAIAVVTPPKARRATRPRTRPTSSRAAPGPRPPVGRHAPAAVVGPAPYCPYCALLLEPPPESSRRCPRCRERIVVRHVDGRAVYLTEASLAIFEAERRRVANSGHWTKERTRWLKAAASVDAPAEKIARLERAPLSDEVVASARSLYLTTVDRSFRAAKHDRRWEDASTIMRDHAMVLFKNAGSPIPPPDESLDAHRLGAAAALRGLGEMSRVAELVSGRCCDACRADDGGLFKIAVELRQPRLPHAGCPKGLCRCDWFLAVRDQSLVRRQLRRRARSESAVRPASE